MPDGKISGTEMNSLNHYSYGSIVEWMYRNMVGIRPSEDGAGFKKFTIAPTPNYQISSAKASLRSASGIIESQWELKDGKLSMRFVVPFDSEAVLVIPDAAIENLDVSQNGILSAVQNGKNVELTVEAGEYVFNYVPTTPYRKIYSIDSPMEELLANEKTKKILDEDYFVYHEKLPFEKELYTFEELLNGPFTYLSYEQQKAIDKRLREVE